MKSIIFNTLKTIYVFYLFVLFVACLFLIPIHELGNFFLKAYYPLGFH